jgi:uncharacterized protein YggE
MKPLLLSLLIACAPLAALADSPRVLSVTGEAEMRAVPDQVNLSLSAVSEGPVLLKVKAANDQKIAKLLAITQKLGIPKEDIKTLYANIQPTYRYVNETQTQVRNGYNVTNTIDITLRKPGLLGALMEQALAAGIDRVDGVNFSLADDKPLKTQVLVKALGNARMKAEKMAAAMGETLGQPLMVSEGAVAPVFPQPQPMMDMAVNKMSMNASVNAESTPGGMIHVGQTVSVSYALK